MKDEKIKIEFYTDMDTSAFLKAFANTMKKTVGELINEICQDFKNDILSYMAEKDNDRNGTDMPQ